MVMSGIRPTLEDFSGLARLHHSALSTSVLGRMGAATLRRYYRWVAESPLEWLFVSRADSTLEAAAVVSLEPASLVRRFAMHRPLPFLWALVRSLAIDGAFRGEALAYFGERKEKDGGAKKPELIQIFVAPDRQGRALGTALLDEVAAALSARGVNVYWVRTLQEDNPGTLAFYQKRGFESDGQLRFCGQRYVLLKKSVPAAVTRS